MSKRAKIGSCGFSQSGSQGSSSSQYGWRFLVPAPSSASVPALVFGGIKSEGTTSSKAHSSASGVRTHPLCGECGRHHQGCVDPLVICVLVLVSQAIECKNVGADSKG